jgi:hypothetical protein
MQADSADANTNAKHENPRLGLPATVKTPTVPNAPSGRLRIWPRGEQIV